MPNLEREEEEEGDHKGQMSVRTMEINYYSPFVARHVFQKRSNIIL